MNSSPDATMGAADFRLMRMTIASVWLVTGAMSLGIYPVQQSLALLARVGLRGDTALFALYGAAMMDLLFGLLTLLRPSTMLWRIQAAIIVFYSAIITLRLPEFWLHPFGPILKNLPILLLLWLLHRHKETAT